MPIINPDTTEAIEMGPIEPGTYPAEIKAVDFQMSKNGNPMIVTSFDVTVEQGKKPRPRKAWIVITGPGSYNFDQLLRATGFDSLADQYKDPEQANPEFDTDNLIGQHLQLVIDNRLDEQGNKRDEIKAYMRA